MAPAIGDDGPFRLLVHNRTAHTLAISPFSPSRPLLSNGSEDFEAPPAYPTDARLHTLDIPATHIAHRRLRLVVHSTHGHRTEKVESEEILLSQCALRVLSPLQNSTSSDGVRKRQEWKATELTGALKGKVWALQSLPQNSSQVLNLLILPARDLSSWLSALSSDLPLSALTLPGSHESCARYGWPISQCQSVISTISKQLLDGLRFLDIRLSVKGEPGKERLLCYHGISDERLAFDVVLKETHEFLDAHPSETVLMSIKQENAQTGFKDLVLNTYVAPQPEKWFLEPRVPTLGEARGKIIMFSRFGSSDEQPGGIHPPIWPDSKKGSFEWTCAGTRVITQDWYDIPNALSSTLSEKFDLVTSLLTSTGSDPSVLSIDFCNGSSFPLAFPPAVAKGWGVGTKCAHVKGINERLHDLLVERVLLPQTASGQQNQAQGTDQAQQERVGAKAVFAIDFYEFPSDAPSLVPLLVEANFEPSPTPPPAPSKK